MSNYNFNKQQSKRNKNQSQLEPKMEAFSLAVCLPTTIQYSDYNQSSFCYLFFIQKFNFALNLQFIFCLIVQIQGLYHYLFVKKLLFALSFLIKHDNEAIIFIKKCMDYSQQIADYSSNHQGSLQLLKNNLDLMEVYFLRLLMGAPLQRKLIPHYIFFMSLLQDSQIESSVYLCSFQCIIKQANISMKFPCSYFVQWSTSNKKTTATSAKHFPQQQAVHFDQKLIIQTQVIYNNKTSQYSKKDTLIQLFLVSKSRPDQNKLVGRVTIDLAKVVNFQMYAQFTEFKLNFCSVEASIILQFHLIDQKLTTLKAHQLDKSSIIDYISQIVLKNNSLNKNLQQQTIINTNSKSIKELKHSLKYQSQIFSANQTSNGQNYRKNIQTEQVRREIDNFQDKPKAFQALKVDSNPIINGADKQITQSIKNQEPIKAQATQEYEKAHIIQKIYSYQSSQPAESPTFLPKISNDNQMQREVTYEYQDDKQKALQMFDQLRQKESIQLHLIALQEDKKKQVQSLKQEKFQLEKIILDMQQRQSSLKQKNQHLYNQINAKNSIIKMLQEQLNEKESKSEHLMKMVESLSQKRQNKSVDETSRQGEKEIAYLQERVRIFEQQINQLNLQLQQAERKQTAYQARFIDLEQMIKTLEFQNDQYKDQLRNELQVREDLQSKVVNAVSSNNVLQAKLNEIIGYQQKKDLQTQKFLKQNEKAKEQLLSNNDTLKNQLQRLSETNLKMKAENQQLFQVYEKSQIKVIQLQNALKQAQTKSSQQNKPQSVQNQGKIAQLEQENKRISEQAQFLKQSLEVLQKQTTEEIQDLKTQNLHLNNHVQQLQNQFQRLYNDVQNKQKALADNRLEIQKQENEELLFQLKNIENEKLSLFQHLQKLQAENSRLSQEIILLQKVKSKQNKESIQQNWQQKFQEYEANIAKVNNNLEEQLNQNNQLSQTILSYMQKQAKMKETLSILEEESKEIFVLFQEKEHNEQTYQKMIQDLQKEIKRLSTNFHQIHNEQVSPNKNVQVSPNKNAQYSPSLKRVKQKWQNSNDQLTETNKKLEQINEELNEELINLKIMYNRLKDQSQAQRVKLAQRINEVSSNNQKANLNQKLGQLEKTIRKKDLQAEITKAKLRQAEQSKSKVQSQLEQVKRQIQVLEEQKFNIQSTSNQKDIRILQLGEQLLSLKAPTVIKKDSLLKQKNQQFFSMILLIKEKLTVKNLNNDWEQLIQNILDKSLLGQDGSKLVNIQQKSRLLSKQLQKLKAHILKGGIKNQQQRLNFMNLIKTCESIIAEIITAAQSLSLNQSSFL